MAKREDKVEDEYRRRLWAQVELAMPRLDLDRQGLAQRWRRSKSTVTRLANGDLPTTLSNVASLAAALDVEPGDLLWPVVEPESPKRAAERALRRAAEQQAQAVSNAHERHITAYLAALDGDQAQRVLRLVGRLGRVAPADLDMVGHMLDGLVAAREREHPAEWPDDLEEHDGQHQ